MNHIELEDAEIEMIEVKRRHWQLPFSDGSYIKEVRIAAESELIYVLNDSGSALSIYNKDLENDKNGEIFSLKNKAITNFHLLSP